MEATESNPSCPKLLDGYVHIEQQARDEGLSIKTIKRRCDAGLYVWLKLGKEIYINVERSRERLAAREVRMGERRGAGKAA